MKELPISILALSFLCILGIYPMDINAASEPECAIWLCLPGGFPGGCEDAHSAFLHRINKGKPPLPPFAECAVGGSEGNYEVGYERLESCREGFSPRQNYFADGGYHANACVASHCAPSGGRQNCEYYVRQARIDPNYVKMWVDGKFIGQYWW